MKTILLAASAALLASTAPAFAQDAAPAMSTPSPEAVTSFTGPRAEIFGGYSRLGHRDRFDGVTSHTHKNGFTGGALLGYDLPIGDRFVVGPFASYALTSNDSCEQGVGCVKSDRQIEGGARFGAKFGNRALVYAKGAYVNGQFRAHVLNDGGTEYVVGRSDRDGWRAGAGVEYALSSHAYVKAEYDYTRFKSLDAGEFAGQNSTTIRFDRNEALGGFGVRF